MLKRIERLLEGRPMLALMLSITVSIVIIRMTPFAAYALNEAQNLQRIGLSTTEQNIGTLVVMGLLMAMAVALLKLVLLIVTGMTKRRNKERIIHQFRLRQISEAEILREILLEELLELYGKYDEEREKELWDTLKEFNLDDLMDLKEMMGG